MNHSSHSFELAWHLLHRRIQILVAILMRDAVAPWAIPVLNVTERALGRFAK